MPMVAPVSRTHRHGTLPPVFAAWLAIRSRGPVCERWRSFSNFYFDVGPRPSWRHLLFRYDATGAFEPGNANGGLQRGIGGGDAPTKGRPEYYGFTGGQVSGMMTGHNL
jgi:hypothetical protein